MWCWTLCHILHMPLIYSGSPAKPLLQAELQPSPKNLIFMMVTPLIASKWVTRRVAQEKDMNNIFPLTPQALLLSNLLLFCEGIGSYQGGTALGSVPKVVVTTSQGMST